MKSFLVILVLALSGCVEYTTQICHENLRVDVDHLEGVWRNLSYSDDEFLSSEHAYSYKRTGVGVYERKDGIIHYTCNVANKLLVEVNSAGRWQSQFLHTSPTVIETISAVIDKRKLELNGIPYQVLENGPNREKTLLIDNSKVEASVLVALMDVVSDVHRLYAPSSPSTAK